MSVLNKVLKAIEEISSRSSIKEWNETDNELFIKFQCKTAQAKIIFTSHWLNEHMQDPLYQMTLIYDGHMIEYTDYGARAFLLDDENFCEININFNKSLAYRINKNVLIFFNMQTFLDKLLGKSLHFFNLDPVKKFVFLPLSESYDNGLVKICPLNNFDAEQDFKVNIEESTYENANSYISLYTDSHTDNSPLPLTFLFYGVKNLDLRNVLNFLVIYLTAKFLANKHHNQKFTFKGYQRIEVTEGDLFEAKHTQEFIQLFKFTYDKNKYDDKIEIARNVITLYLSDADDLEKFDLILPKIRGTIEANFSAYIQKQIKEFFDQRKDVVKEAYNASTEAKGEADKVISSINQILLGLITASLTGVFAYSKGDKFLFILALGFHAIYFVAAYIVNYKNFESKEKDIETHFDLYVEQFSVLKDEELFKIKKNHVVPALKRLSNHLAMYTGATFIIIMILLASAVIGYEHIEKNPVSNSVNTSTKTQQK